MFRGINSINMDGKGRIALPARYRDSLRAHCEGQLVVTVNAGMGSDDGPCLLLYPLPEWEEIEAKISALPNVNRNAKHLQRRLIGHATELELDGNGRILLPTKLREHAGIEKKVALVGQGHKFEIWDEDRWDALMQTEIAPDEAIPDEMQNLTL